MSRQTLDPDEVRALRTAYARAVRPDRVSRGPAGCLVAVVAIALFIGLPRLLAWTGVSLPRSVGVAVGSVLLAAALGGGAVALLGGGRTGSSTRARAAGALDTLADDALGPDERRAATAELLANAHVQEGPATTAAFDLETARRRLGTALSYVLAAERALREDPGIPPVFTPDRNGDRRPA